MADENINHLLDALGIAADYGANPARPRYAEAAELVDVGPNIVGIPQRVTPDTADAWRKMCDSAAAEGIELLLVSGFRSIAYQAELIARKLAAGQSLADVLAVNAAPGFSQHHSGCAVDIATPGARPLTLEFEATAAFAWLTANAARFGFRMPYPAGNRFGFAYEPWHWSRLDD